MLTNNAEDDELVVPGRATKWCVLLLNEMELHMFADYKGFNWWK